MYSFGTKFHKLGLSEGSVSIPCFIDWILLAFSGTQVLIFLCNFIKKETLTKVFSCDIFEIFKNTIFYITPPVAASGFIKPSVPFFQSFLFTGTILEIFANWAKLSDCTLLEENFPMYSSLNSLKSKSSY